MQTYENSYFHLCIGIPDNWKLTSWRRAKIPRSYRSAYQSQDDDLPKKGPCASKFLFTAALYSAASEALVDADIEMSVFRLAPHEEMRTSLVKNLERERDYYESNGIAQSITKEGVWIIDSVSFDHVDQESMSRGKCSRYRFFFRRVDDVFWLYGKIAGHKESAFADALKLVGDMRFTGAIGA